MPLETSYTGRAAGSPGSGIASEKQGQYWPLAKLRKCYTDYLFSKREEIDEQIDARRYYHGSQWTDEQLRVMQKRKQPVMTFNRVARKIDGVIGQLEKQRFDPKAYPRTPQHEEGAELATATVRYVLDKEEWGTRSPIAATDGAVDGIGGMELILEQGDRGDLEVGLALVDVQSFFYDPNSYKDDFSDARYMGIGKWVDEDIARQDYPDADDAAFEGDGELQHSTDRELRWFKTDGVVKRVRIIDIWYRHNGGWCWAVFTGGAILKEGKGPFKDEKGEAFCKFLMFSGNVDQDGDRYGFVRNLKSPQDGINARQSKMQHILASNRLFIRQGGTADGNVEKVRAEMARPDGVIVTVGNVNESVQADDRTFDFAGWTKLLELNLSEIENFGPNRTLLGEGGVDTRSGRAIAMLHQAGMAELGPYMLAYRGWKLRVYRAIWNAVQQHWKEERWIRVTDDAKLNQFIQINGLGIDQNGKPTIINQLGALDVDIIMDEGPDTINRMADDYEVLETLAAKGVQLPPQILIELTPLAPERKKRIIEMYEQAMQAQPQPVDPAMAKLEEAKMNGQIRLVEMEQEAAIKQKELEQNAYFEQQKLNQELAFNQQKMQQEGDFKRQQATQDFVLTKEKQDNEVGLTREKHGAEIQMAREKGEVDKQIATEKLQVEATIKTQQAEGQAAPVKKIAGDLIKTLETIAGELKESMDAPRKINIKRDQSGKVVGAESIVA